MEKGNYPRILGALMFVENVEGSEPLKKRLNPIKKAKPEIE